MSAIPLILEPKLQIKSKKEVWEILEIEKWRKVGVLSFDPINLSETPKHFLLHANFSMCVMKRARNKKTLYIIYIVWSNPIRLSLCLVRIQLEPFSFTLCRPLLYLWSVNQMCLTVKSVGKRIWCFIETSQYINSSTPTARSCFWFHLL